jgi:hypothetical protein
MWRMDFDGLLHIGQSHSLKERIIVALVFALHPCWNVLDDWRILDWNCFLCITKVNTNL